MANFLLLICCLLAGMLLRRTGRMPDNAHVALNAVIINLSLPAVTLRALHAFRFDPSNLWPVLMPWILFAIGAVIFAGIGKFLRLPRSTIGALTLVGGLGNTSFVGLPMIEALNGRDGLGLGLLIDQLGSYLALSTVGVTVASFYAGGKQTSLREMMKKVVTFPPVIALFTALLLRSVEFPAPLDTTLGRIGDTLAPLALLSVGLQLRFDAIRQQAMPLSLGLGYKLLACPAMVVFTLWLAGPQMTMASRVSVIEAAMPPMIGAGIIAAQANLNAPLVSTLIGLGIPLGLSTAPAWHWLFVYLAT